jgi:hypothetical protein
MAWSLILENGLYFMVILAQQTAKRQAIPLAKRAAAPSNFFENSSFSEKYLFISVILGLSTISIAERF